LLRLSVYIFQTYEYANSLSDVAVLIPITEKSRKY